MLDCGLWNVIGYCWALYSYLRFTLFYSINEDTDGPCTAILDSLCSMAYTRILIGSVKLF